MNLYDRKARLNQLIRGSLELVEEGKKDEVQIPVLVRAAQSVGLGLKHVKNIIEEGYPQLRIVDDETVVKK